MKKTFLRLLAVLGIAGGAYHVGDNHEFYADKINGQKEFIVLTEPGKITALHGATVIDQLQKRNGYVVKTNSATAQKLRDSGAEVFENRTYTAWQGCTPMPKPPTDPGPAPGPVGEVIPWGTEKVRALQAQASKSGRKIRVCVVDTGVAPHEDIQIVASKSFVSGEGAADLNGHGTHVAGTIGALKGNQKGIVGVAAGVAEIVGVKVLGKNGSGSGANIADGIYWSVDDAKCEVINMSLGSPRQYGPDPYIRRATDYAVSKGVLIAAAAGNDGQSSGCGYPAANPGVDCVSALSPSGRKASFSTYGPDVDYILPGEDVVSLDFRGGYISFDGTSMASPHHAAILALCKSVNCPGIKTTSLGLSRNEEGKGLPDAYETVR